MDANLFIAAIDRCFYRHEFNIIELLGMQMGYFTQKTGRQASLAKLIFKGGFDSHYLLHNNSMTCDEVQANQSQYRLFLQGP